MRVKMVKMGSDYTTPINCRMRGIVITEDNKHLFVEVGCGYSPNIKHTSLTQKEYDVKYPNSQYVCVDFCYRVDIPEDSFKNNSKEYSNYTKKLFLEIPYTKEGIITFLQKLNPKIDDIELVNEHYIEKYCEEKGFFELYDNRLKHKKEFVDIRWLDPELKGDMRFNYKYICYAANGTEYSEIIETKGKIEDIILEYGKENLKPFIDKYIKEICDNHNYSDKLKSAYTELRNEIFNDNKINLEIEDEYTDI